MIQWIWLVPDITPAMAGAAVVAPPALLHICTRSYYSFPVLIVMGIPIISFSCFWNDLTCGSASNAHVNLIQCVIVVLYL